MLIGLLFFLLIAGAVVMTPFILALVALSRWADARRRRVAAEDSPEPLPAAAP